jgi:aconitate hydratase
MLRRKGVVGKFVEFYGPGLANLPLADRATIGNMAPEYGATCGFFPIDEITLHYLRLTGRDPKRVALVEAYAKEQGMWRWRDVPDPVFSDTLELDMCSIEPSIAGPRRPQDRVPLRAAKQNFEESFAALSGGGALDAEQPVRGADYSLHQGDVVIAAITSCTNTSNPSVMIGAGLIAKKAAERGLAPKPWVKTSLAPGSRVVTEYLKKADLQRHLDAIGFETVGYGCTTCIGNSGPLPDPIADAVTEAKLTVAAVLSGNRNFEGRIHPQVRANYLASPPLVVAYALAGSMRVDITSEPLGTGSNGQPVYLKDVWPTTRETDEAVRAAVSDVMFRESYADVFAGDARWQAIGAGVGGTTYNWDEESTYIRLPTYFEGMERQPAASVPDIKGARILGLFGDSITTDHISPAGNIAKTSPAAKYLTEHGVEVRDFNSYGARRGNHEVMVRGTFANIRIKNEMVPGTEGGVTKLMPEGQTMSIYDAAMAYVQRGTPLVVVAGKEYGTGSSRDWAAKGTLLLGVKAVLAESFERIHRSNLVGMGVLPLTFKEGQDRKSLGLDGSEVIDVVGLEQGLKPRMDLTLRVHRADGRTDEVAVLCRLDTLDEVDYYRNGGILQYVLRQLLREAEPAGRG